MCLMRDVGGVCIILGRNMILRTKNVRIFETEFLGLGIMRALANQTEKFDDDSSELNNGDTSHFARLQSSDSRGEDTKYPIPADILT